MIPLVWPGGRSNKRTTRRTLHTLVRWFKTFRLSHKHSRPVPVLFCSHTQFFFFRVMLCFSLTENRIQSINFKSQRNGFYDRMKTLGYLFVSRRRRWIKRDACLMNHRNIGSNYSARFCVLGSGVATWNHRWLLSLNTKSIKSSAAGSSLGSLSFPGSARTHTIEAELSAEQHNWMTW